MPILLKVLPGRFGDPDCVRSREKVPGTEADPPDKTASLYPCPYSSVPVGHSKISGTAFSAAKTTTGKEQSIIMADNTTDNTLRDKTCFFKTSTS